MPGPVAVAEARQVLIGVVDRAGRAIVGAEIDVFLDGELAATITSSGRSSIEVDDPNVAIRLEVSVGHQKQKADLSASDERPKFVFEQHPLALAAAKPGGRCPDGTTGQPCVVCKVGSQKIRVCG